LEVKGLGCKDTKIRLPSLAGPLALCPSTKEEKENLSGKVCFCCKNSDL